MENYRKTLQVFDLFLDSIDIDNQSPFFCVTIHPNQKEIRLLSWMEEYSYILSKIESIYKIKFVADDSNDLCAEFNINNVLINISFCN